MRRVLILFILLLVVRIADGQTALAPYTDADAYEIYSVLLKPDEPVSKGKVRKTIIQIETEDYPSFGDDKTKCLVPAKGEEPMYAPVIESYRKENETRWLLQPKFVESVPYQLVSEASIDDLFDKGVDGGWKAFYKKYPGTGGFMTMSAVGYNADRTLAIVYVGNSCGGLCGAGSYRVLRKTDGKWAEIRWNGMICTWLS